jgi:hypothetical protein
MGHWGPQYAESLIDRFTGTGGAVTASGEKIGFYDPTGAAGRVKGASLACGLGLLL